MKKSDSFFKSIFVLPKIFFPFITFIIKNGIMQNYKSMGVTTKHPNFEW